MRALVPFAAVSALTLCSLSPPARADDAPKASENPLRISGFIQADAVLHRQSSQDELDPSTREPLNEDRVLIRRARLAANYAKGAFASNLEIDGNTLRDPDVRVLGADVALRVKNPGGGEPLLVAALGLVRIPFGYETQQRDRDLRFLERSIMARALFPGGWDLGLKLSGGYRFLRYVVAAMNGVPNGDRAFFPKDPTKSKDVLARVGVVTEVMPGVRFEGGVSGTSGLGFHPGTPSSKDVLAWRDLNEDGLVQTTEINVVAGAAATPSQTFKRFALGADARLFLDVPRVGTLALLAEIAWAKNLDRGLVVADPVARGRDSRHFGFYVSASQEVTEHGVVAFRYEKYKADADARDQLGASLVPSDISFSSVAVLAGVRFPPGRLLLEYDHNQNPLGRSASGAPTTLADDALTLRAEVNF